MKDYNTVTVMGPNGFTTYSDPNGVFHTQENLEVVSVLLSDSPTLPDSTLKVSVRPVGTPSKPFYKFNYRIESQV